jgi:hypothetical protein
MRFIDLSHVIVDGMVTYRACLDLGSASISAGRRPMRVTRRERRSASRKSGWWRTPGPIWIRPPIDTAMGGG